MGGTEPQHSLASARTRTVLDLNPVTPETTVADAAALFLAALKHAADLNPRRLSTYHSRSYGLSLLTPELRAAQLGQLRRSWIVNWVDSLRGRKGQRKPVLEAADRTGRVTLSALLSWCADRNDDLELLPYLMRRIRFEYSAPPGRSLTLEDFNVLRDDLAFRDRPARGSRENSTLQVSIRVLRVIADNGARAFEVRTAKVDQFCPERGALVWPRGKNKKPRVIVLSPRTADICRLQAKTPLARSTGYLFPSPVTGEPLTHQPLNRLLRRVAEAAGIPCEISMHDLRRTLATIAFEGGATIEEIALNLGNTPQLVRDVYVCTAVSPAARKVNAMLNPPTQQRARRAA